MTSSDLPSPWYKQFWPWFLITVPLVSIIVGSTMLTLALKTENSMVVDDYYKEGKAINYRIAKIKRAKDLGIASEMLINEEQIQLSFTSGQVDSSQNLSLRFYHPTLEDRDFSLQLLRDARGNYSAFLPNEIGGKWQVTLIPFNEEWKIQTEIALPRSGPIPLIPE